MNVSKMISVYMLAAIVSGCSDKAPLYKDPAQPIEKRVEDLLDRMTLTEKAAQMVSVDRVYAMIAEEVRARGVHQALTPVVDVARDARWGRIEETYGEDPYLTSQMGIAAIRGFQNDGTFKEKKHIIGTLKHFAAHGQPEGGTNTAPANYSERVLREVHFFPFKEAIQKAGAISVMTTYHEIDGVPVNANRWLVNDLLRDEWGFDGFVVSDYYSIREMHERDGVGAHRIAADGKHAAELAIHAGVNIELPNPDCYNHIPELL